MYISTVGEVNTVSSFITGRSISRQVVAASSLVARDLPTITDNHDDECLAQVAGVRGLVGSGRIDSEWAV